MMKWFESNHFVNKTYVKKKKFLYEFCMCEKWSCGFECWSTLTVREWQTDRMQQSWHAPQTWWKFCTLFGRRTKPMFAMFWGSLDWWTWSTRCLKKRNTEAKSPRKLHFFKWSGKMVLFSYFNFVSCPFLIFHDLSMQL